MNFPTTDHAAAGCGLLHQLCCGYAVFLPFTLLPASTTDVSAAPIYSAMLSAGVLIAFGAGLPFHSRLSRRMGLHVATRVGLLSTASGIVVTTVGSSPWASLAGCLLIGFGLFGEWTPSADLTRGSLCSTRLWRGMRIHSAMLFFGALFAVVTVAAQTDIVLMAASFTIIFICCVLSVLVRPMPTARVVDSRADSSHDTHGTLCEAMAAGCEGTAEQADIHSASDCDESNPDSCEAENCCGGGGVWTPMPVWLGSCLAFAGMYAIGVLLPGLMNNPNQTSVGLVVVGSLLGTLLFQAVVPTTGYAVLLAPVCLSGTVIFGIALWIPDIESELVLAIQAAVAAAIWCGCSGLIGESFVDSGPHRSRTLVLMIGSMAAAAAGLVAGIIATWVSPTAASATNSILCFVAILWLRRIPSPLVSQRRQDAVSPEEAERMLSESFGVAGGSAE